MRLRAVPPLLFVATSLFAQPVITGISPSQGPTGGGTEVTMTGTGLAREFSGNEPSRAVHIGDVPVRSQDAVRRYLVPILVPPIPGAYGAEFRSRLDLWNASPWPAEVEGVFRGPICDVCAPTKMTLEPGHSASAHSYPVTAGNPGRFIEVASEVADLLAMNLRVYDTSRASTNFGTEIPVVPVSAFRNSVVLTGIPVDSRYRLMLRIYGDMEGSVVIAFGSTRRSVPLSRPLASGPSYAELAVSDATLPQRSTANLSIIASPDILASPVLSRIWAFITVTNNETQHITTITPQSSR